MTYYSHFNFDYAPTNNIKRVPHLSKMKILPMSIIGAMLCQLLCFSTGFVNTEEGDVAESYGIQHAYDKPTDFARIRSHRMLEDFQRHPWWSRRRWGGKKKNSKTGVHKRRMQKKNKRIHTLTNDYMGVDDGGFQRLGEFITSSHHPDEYASRNDPKAIRIRIRVRQRSPVKRHTKQSKKRPKKRSKKRSKKLSKKHSMELAQQEAMALVLRDFLRDDKHDASLKKAMRKAMKNYHRASRISLHGKRHRGITVKVRKMKH